MTHYIYLLMTLYLLGNRSAIKWSVFCSWSQNDRKENLDCKYSFRSYDTVLTCSRASSPWPWRGVPSCLPSDSHSDTCKYIVSPFLSWECLMWPHGSWYLLVVHLLAPVSLHTAPGPSKVPSAEDIKVTLPHSLHFTSRNVGTLFTFITHYIQCYEQKESLNILLIDRLIVDQIYYKTRIWT